jgi:membrane protease YdiL (CAAX protease family)
MRDIVRRHETAAFVTLTFGFAWPLWLLSGILGRADLRAPDWRWAVAQVGVLAPAFAGLLVAACVEPGAGRRAVRTLLFVYLPAITLAFALARRGYASFVDIGPMWTAAIAALGAWALFWFARGANRLVAWPGERASGRAAALWTLGALVVPALLFVPCWLALAPSRAVPPEAPAIVRELSLFGIASALTVNLALGGTLGEEPGWRGVWLPRLLRREGPLAASLTLGVAWSLWHAPIDLAQGFGATGPFALLARLVWTLPLTLLFTWVTVRAGGSLLPAFALHTGINVIPDFAMKDPGRYERAMGLFVLLVLVLGVAVLLADRRLRRPVVVAARAAVVVAFGLLLGGRSALAQGTAAGLPLVDLAAETGRQVIVDREAGQYLGHPTTVLLEDGNTILCVYPKGHGKGAILYKRSEDGGKTWSARLPTPPSWETSLETPTIYRTVDRAGKKRLLLFSGLYPIRLSVSEDDGKSWSELRPIGPYGGIVAMAALVPLRNGSHLAMFHDDGRFFREGGQADGVFRLYQVRSEDGGLAWSEPRLVFQSGEVHLCEPGLVRSPDGKRLAALLRENRRVKNSHVIFSDDEGKTWTAPRELPASLTGDRHVLRYAPDGRLFATFRDKAAGSPTKGDWVGWVGRWEDVVEGRPGEYRVRLMKNHHRDDCAYPGLELLPDGTFVTTTYGHWTAGEPPYVVSVRFTLAELDARRGR